MNKLIIVAVVIIASQAALAATQVPILTETCPTTGQETRFRIMVGDPELIMEPIILQLGGDLVEINPAYERVVVFIDRLTVPGPDKQVPIVQERTSMGSTAGDQLPQTYNPQPPGHIEVDLEIYKVDDNTVYELVTVALWPRSYDLPVTQFWGPMPKLLQPVKVRAVAVRVVPND